MQTLPITIAPEEVERCKEYFWAHVERKSECLLWTGQIENEGYGRLHWPLADPNRKVLAHRWAYVLFSGKSIPNELEPDHTCRNRACVNWKHLELVTHQVNSLRGVRSPTAINAVKTHCRRGHELTTDNLVPWLRKSGRICWKCSKEYQVRYQADYYQRRKKAANV